MAPSSAVGQQQQRAATAQQRARLNGGDIIKTYVHEADRRREYSRFNNTTGSVHALNARESKEQQGKAEPDDDTELRGALPTSKSHVEDVKARSVRSNNQEDDASQPLAAFFADRRGTQRGRRPTSNLALQHHQLNLHAVGGLYRPTTPIKPVVTKRKLQMESIGLYPSRPATTVHITGPRAKNNNLAAKLDAIAKNSTWMRRKVASSDDRAGRAMQRMGPYSPRHGSTVIPTATVSSGENGPTHSPEAESRVMAAFSQIVRLWRERKRRTEARALSLMNNSTNKRLAAQSSNVVGILSRRVIREVPALKFFDEESTTVSSTKPRRGGNESLAQGGTNAATKPFNSAAAASPMPRATPKGVCYTLDAQGCRCIKMQSGVLHSAKTGGNNGRMDGSKKPDEITMEKAMARSLHRKMAKRVKTKRLSILRLSEDFQKSRREQTLKLQSQLALHHAQGEKMFNKRLALLMSDDTSLPAYEVGKEVHLARVRSQKADLLEKCHTLSVLGKLLKHVEAAGEASGLGVSTDELRFLELFRCVVEVDQVLTPVICDGLQQQVMQRSAAPSLVVQELLAIVYANTTPR